MNDSCIGCLSHSFLLCFVIERIARISSNAMSEETSGTEAAAAESRDSLGEPSKILIDTQDYQNNKTELFKSSTANLLQTNEVIANTDSGPNSETRAKRILQTSVATISQKESPTKDSKLAPIEQHPKKVLQLMNILSKHPEKCQKWLKGQDLLREKLGEKYKPPLIYLTVKQFAQSHSEKCKDVLLDESKDDCAPKAQVSLDLLNNFYLNPDKCNTWLKNQEVLKKIHGEMYKEHVLYSTVTQIAMYHSSQSSEVSKLEGSSKNATPIEDGKNTTPKQKNLPQQQENENTSLRSRDPKANILESKSVTKPEPVVVITSKNSTVTQNTICHSSHSSEVLKVEGSSKNATPIEVKKIIEPKLKNAPQHQTNKNASLRSNIETKKGKAVTEPEPVVEINSKNSTVTQNTNCNSSQSSKVLKVEGSPKNATPIEVKKNIEPKLKSAPPHQTNKNASLRSDIEFKMLSGEKWQKSTTELKANPITYILFSPKLRAISECKKMVGKQMNISKVLGKQFRMPRFDPAGKKMAFRNSVAEFTYVKIPCKTSHQIQFQYPRNLDEFVGLTWLKLQLTLIERHGENNYKFPICNNQGHLIENCEKSATCGPIDTFPPVYQVPSFHNTHLNSYNTPWSSSPYATISQGWQDPSFYTIPPYGEAPGQYGVPAVAQPFYASSETAILSAVESYPTTVHAIPAGLSTYSTPWTVKTREEEKKSLTRSKMEEIHQAIQPTFTKEILFGMRINPTVRQNSNEALWDKLDQEKSTHFPEKSTGHETSGQTTSLEEIPLPSAASLSGPSLPAYTGKPLFPTAPAITTPPLPPEYPTHALQTHSRESSTKTEPERTPGKSKLSAFERLGPVVAEPKKPKLTISLMFAQDEKKDVREVVEEHVPVFLRQDILASRDLIVEEYLKVWPWSRPVRVMHEASFQSNDLLHDEFEMVGCYKSKSAWIKVVVTGYAPHLKKEEVLDVLLNCLGKAEFIPCFVEFKLNECMFLLNRSEKALTLLHRKGLVCERDGIKLNLVVSQTNLTLENLRFYKGAVFKAKLNKAYNQEMDSLNLSAFQLQPDNSHFMYFPLNYEYNQTFIMNVVKALLPWENITTIDLSDNRLTSIGSFDFSESAPSLRSLNLSGNLLPTVSTLACARGLRLYSLRLEGNPLCRNFIEKEHYIEVVKLLFPSLRVLDGIEVNYQLDIKRNFSVAPEAEELVNSFLEIFFRLMDSNDKSHMMPLYSDKAVFSITCQNEMRRNPKYNNLKEFYMWCRSLQDSINPDDPLEGAIVGGLKIVKYFTKWPIVMHDPYSFTVDVVLHTESSTIIKVTGLIKIPAESLNQDEPIIEFSRTFVLITDDGIEYKISNDMMYISAASEERIASGFKFVGQQHQKRTDDVNMKFDCPPDEDLKDKLTLLFMQITKMSKKSSERSLNLEDWDLRKALEYFIKHEKLDSGIH